MTQVKEHAFATVGFIGLGTMGHRMVRHLKGSATLLVSDANAAAAAAAAEAVGGRAVAVADMAAADAVILMLPTSQVVDAVLRGEGGKGLFDALKPGALIIDMSSSAPTNSVANAEEARRRGLRFVDAPVSGGAIGAEKGTLAIMVGGDAADYEAARPLLLKMGPNVFHVGRVGAGHAVKALNNLMSATALAVNSEAFAVGEKFGLDPAMMLKVVNASSGQNWVSTTHWQPQIVDRKFACGFTMQLLEKDVRVAMSLYDAMGAKGTVSRSVAASCAQSLRAAAPGADMSVMAQQAQQELGLGSAPQQPQPGEAVRA
ncbi:NAD(P)-dependent oxidoreductase [Cupriavidus sp. 30B13]|uniref:NAD(P)-dependent oxidoreductase n=1 Tax=Cupriavidus sp. 30B13 TaxID=3384241 RepID=UPI003CF09D42